MTTERARRRGVRGLAACALAGAFVLASGAPAWADAARSGEWQLTYLGIPAAQQITQGDNIVVAVIDTGVNPSQPELKGSVLTGADATHGFTGTGQKADSAHGTGLAGLIAGHGKTADTGTLGIAPKAKILPVRVPSSPKAVDLEESVTWAVRHGAQVICLGVTSGADAGWAAVLDEAFRDKAVIVAPVGDHVSSVAWPAAYPGVVAVGGVDHSGKRATFSATGPEVLLTAPAAAITAPGARGLYQRTDSTTTAAAITAGVAALVKAEYPDLSTVELVNRLTATAVAAGDSGRDSEYGYGIVDPVSALTQTVPRITPLPSASANLLPTPRAPTSVAKPPGSRNWPLAGAVLIAILGVAAVLVVSIPDRRS